MLVRSCDIEEPAASLKEIRMKYKVQSKQATIQLTKELLVDWTTACHMCIIQALEDAKELPNKLSKFNCLLKLFFCFRDRSF